ncbi:MAG: hypothetical protein ACYCU5_14685 [Actinomycetes bacterium]
MVVIRADAQQVAFIREVAPYVARAARATGLDPRLILAQWALESGWTASGKPASPYNLAGLVFGSRLASFSGLSAFEASYVRSMLGPLYRPVRQAGSLWGQERALAASPWSSDHYAGGALGQILSAILAFGP